ncbi:folylpolyglutamate synthase/dihydropteroate synthase [Rhizobium ruizarguesonis]
MIAEAMANFEERQSRPLFLIIGMINTRDPVGYFKAFTGLVEKVFCVPIRGSEAMVDPVILSNAAYDAGLVAEPMLKVGDALEAIKAFLDPEELPPRILVGRSLYLVGDVLADNGTPPK